MSKISAQREVYLANIKESKTEVPAQERVQTEIISASKRKVIVPQV